MLIQFFYFTRETSVRALNYAWNIEVHQLAVCVAYWTWGDATQ
jgi:hypothetical protein